MATISEIIDLLMEISDDSNSTKNLKLKISHIVSILKADSDISLKKNKASHELDELAANNDVDSYTRTQLLGIVGALETVEE
ncbi:TPA: hypothetical protein HA219_02055 [Candidatus Woesearchaeota archaeon]|nr:hypothetical protein [uncultured archaeon]AQS32108.1 hypothetical protein [uncultured archaeon]MBS3115301.1 UPF0147 family protein [Candidatus Woesearchaeota archaeon]HIH39483.1 hypothetical protein [Candidatus Woesearchaeota archaeon]